MLYMTLLKEFSIPLQSQNNQIQYGLKALRVICDPYANKSSFLLIIREN